MYGSEEVVRTLIYDFGLVFPLGAFSGIVAIIFQLKVIGIEKPNKTSGIIDDMFIERNKKSKMPRFYTVGQVIFCISLLLFGLVFIPGVITRGSDQALETFMLIVTPVFFGASGLIYTVDVIKKIRMLRISHKE